MFPVSGAGSKLVPVTPIPLHVPPVVPLSSEVRFIIPAEEHIVSATNCHDGLTSGLIKKFLVTASVHAPNPAVYVTATVVPANPDGLNVFPITPVPLHVPPVVEVPKSNGLRFMVPAASHNVSGP